MSRSVLFALGSLLSLSICSFATPPITVDCDAGQSLSRTISKLDKLSPATVKVTGACTEFVVIDGFNNLTLKGMQGANLQQPATNPKSSSYLLSIRASRSVTVSGFAIHSQPSIFSSVGIGGGSTDIVLQNVTAEGSWGVVIYEASQVWLVKVKTNLTSGFAAISAFDKSDVHIVDSVMQRPADSNFDAGLFVASGHVTIQGSTIRDMQFAMDIVSGGSVDLVNFDANASGVDVTIDNPSGKNFYGALVSDSSSLNISSAKLHINNAGQPWGGDTGAVFVDNGSTLNTAASLVVTGSQGEGVTVSNNSHAQFGGSSITGSAHGGLVVTNLSTATADPTNPLTVISGNGTDLFCDSRSQIAGALNIANAATVQCNNLIPGVYENLP